MIRSSVLGVLLTVGLLSSAVVAEPPPYQPPLPPMLPFPAIDINPGTIIPILPDDCVATGIGTYGCEADGPVHRNVVYPEKIDYREVHHLASAWISSTPGDSTNHPCNTPQTRVPQAQKKSAPITVKKVQSVKVTSSDEIKLEAATNLGKKLAEMVGITLSANWTRTSTTTCECSDEESISFPVETGVLACWSLKSTAIYTDRIAITHVTRAKTIRLFRCPIAGSPSLIETRAIVCGGGATVTGVAKNLGAVIGQVDSYYPCQPNPYANEPWLLMEKSEPACPGLHPCPNGTTPTCCQGCS